MPKLTFRFGSTLNLSPTYPSIRVSACGSIEGGVLAETSEAIENRDRTNGIVQRIVRSSGERVDVAVNGIDHIQSVGAGDGRAETSRRVVICLGDAMDRAAETDGVVNLVNR